MADKLKLKEALQRREIAMEMARLMTFMAHEEHGFQQVTVQQIAKTDQEIFARIAEHSKGRLEMTPDGTPPLNALLTIVLAEPRAERLLAQKAAEISIAKHLADADGASDSFGSKRKGDQEVQRLRDAKS